VSYLTQRGRHGSAPTLRNRAGLVGEAEPLTDRSKAISLGMSFPVFSAPTARGPRASTVATHESD
jgi:hypothetical protein